MNKSYMHLNPNTENIIKDGLPNTIVCNKLTSLYSLFSDSTRLKIIVSLLSKQMCVNDLSTLLSINQTTISHQLKILRSRGAVTSYRQNKFIFYSIDNKFISDIMFSGIDFITNKAG